MAYYDDEDLSIERRFSQQSSKGLYAFFIAMLTLLVFVGIAIIWFIFLHDGPAGAPGDPSTRMMVFLVLGLDIVALFMSITAIVLGSQAMMAFNDGYRGMGMAALIIGIVDTIICLVVGFCFTCVGALAILGP